MVVKTLVKKAIKRATKRWGKTPKVIKGGKNGKKK